MIFNVLQVFIIPSVYLLLYMTRVPSFLNFNNSTVKKGLARYLSYIRFMFRFGRNFLNRLII